MLSKSKISFLFACLLPAFLDAAYNLPGGIKKCKNDDKLNDCIQKQSKDVTKALAKGDPKFGIPVVDPLFIPKIERTEGGSKSVSMNLTMEDINIYGFGDSEIIKTEFDTSSKKFLRLVFKVPKLKILSHYNLNGKFLVINMNGKGNLTVVMDNVTVISTITYKMEKRKGNEYAIFNPTPNLTYTTTHAFFNLENLFNGDKALGDATNKMINENWEEFNNELGPGVALAIGKVYGLIVSKLANSMPFKDLFL